MPTGCGRSSSGTGLRCGALCNGGVAFSPWASSSSTPAYRRRSRTWAARGYREWGVPTAGAFDRGSAALANALVGNPPGCAVLELTLFGGMYEARIPLALALAGAPMAASIESLGEAARARSTCRRVSRWLPGERLFLGGVAAGARTYLAVKGGWRTPLLLGSRSREDRLRAGDVLDAEPGRIAARRPAEIAVEGS